MSPESGTSLPVELRYLKNRILTIQLLSRSVSLLLLRIRPVLGSKTEQLFYSFYFGNGMKHYLFTVGLVIVLLF